MPEWQKWTISVALTVGTFLVIAALFLGIIWLSTNVPRDMWKALVGGALILSGIAIFSKLAYELMFGDDAPKSNGWR